jgi:hypothetical protein
VEKLSVEPPAKVPLSSTERSRLHRARKQAANETRQGVPTALPAVSAPSIAPEAVAPLKEPASAFSNAVALVAAVALACVAAFFSLTGMAEVFPGAPVAVMVLAGSMEAGKLVIVGWLAAHWPVAGWKLRTVLVALVTGLALINAAGVFGKLVEAHVGAAATARSGISERMEVVDARLTSQSTTVADLDHRISQIDTAVDESTRRGQVGRAMALVDQQRKTRDGLVATRQAASATLIEMQAQRAGLTAERERIEAARGPVQYLAVLVGTDAETAVRWLILLMVLCCTRQLSRSRSRCRVLAKTATPLAVTAVIALPPRAATVTFPEGNDTAFEGSLWCARI